MTRETPAVTWIVLASILIVTALVYHGVTDNRFVLDDRQTVEDNPSIRSLHAAWNGFFSPRAASATPENRNYRPLTIFSYALDYALLGRDAAGFHATNLLIHLGVVCLTFVLGRRIWRYDAAGLVAAGVVALHPINAEAVNYVTARSSSLMTLFLLAAVWAVDRAGPERRRPVLLAAYVLGLLALCAKEGAVVLPLLILIWYRLTAGDREPWRTTWRSVMPWFALTGGFLAIRAWILSTAYPNPGNTQFPWSQDLALSLKIYLTSMGQWMWPAALAPDHAWPIVITASESLLVATGAVAALAATMWVVRWAPRSGWCLIWFWVGVAPAGALPFVSRMTLYQDHRVYLGGIAMAWLAGGAAIWIARAYGGLMPVRTAGMMALVVIGAAAGWADMRQTEAWRNSAALWDDVLRKYPDSVLARVSKGNRLLEEGRLDEARDWAEGAVRLAPGFSTARQNLGAVLLRQGDLESAVAQLETALRIHPHYTAAALSLGEAYERLGTTEATALYDRLLQRNPEWVPVLLRSAALLERQGDLEAAATRYRTVRRIEPNNEGALVGLGSVLIKAEQWGAAREVFAAFLASHPRSFGAHFYLGMTHAREGQDEPAMWHWLDAVKIDSEDSELWYELGLLHARGGRWRDAVEAFDAALTRDPSHVLAHFNLAVVAENAQDVERARSHYAAVIQHVSIERDEGLRAKAAEAIARLGTGGGGRDERFRR